MVSSQKKGYLIYEGTSLVLELNDPNVWPFINVANDSFRATVGEQNLGAIVLLKGTRKLIIPLSGTKRG